MWQQVWHDPCSNVKASRKEHIIDVPMRKKCILRKNVKQLQSTNSVNLRNGVYLISPNSQAPRSSYRSSNLDLVPVGQGYFASNFRLVGIFVPQCHT